MHISLWLSYRKMCITPTQTVFTGYPLFKSSGIQRGGERKTERYRKKNRKTMKYGNKETETD